MKIAQLLEQLTPEEILQFVSNATKNRHIDSILSDECKDMYEWIATAFVWSETPQGNEYWYSIACRQTK
jgi:hypothetical protein